LLKLGNVSSSHQAIGRGEALRQMSLAGEGLVKVKGIIPKKNDDDDDDDDDGVSFFQNETRRVVFVNITHIVMRMITMTSTCFSLMY